jgi:hypothetical protein
MRHQRFVVRLARLFNGFASVMVSETVAALCLNDLTLFGRDIDEREDDGGRIDSSSRAADVGAEVGAGPREVIDDCDERDRTDGVASVAVAELSDGRSSTPGRFADDIRGLCTADGIGLPCTLYTPPVPNEFGVEYGMGCTWRRKDS